MSENIAPVPVRKDRGSPRKKNAISGENVSSEMVRRVPPHSDDAETAVLAGIFMRPHILNSLVDVLKPEDFYVPAHALIYASMLRLDEKHAPIDLVTVAEELKETGTLEDAGGAVYLGQLAQAVVSGANAAYYGQMVRDKALQRNLINTCANIIGNCYDPAHGVDTLIDESEQAILSVSTSSNSSGFTPAKELMSIIYEHIAQLHNHSEELTGIGTGFERLDQLTSGLQRSDLIIIAARPSMGKTAFALNLALNAAMDQNQTVAIFSLEMSKEQLMQRMIAIRARVELSKLRKPKDLEDDDWERLYRISDPLANTALYIDDSPALTTIELRSRARRLKAERGLDLIIIDYLQLMRSSRRTDSRELEISDISRSLKALAKELDIPVVALAQLNRKVEERNDKRPLLSDLRESGAIEQDADVIMFIYRDAVYAIKEPEMRPEVGEAEIIIGKQRNGPVGTARLMYISKYTSFESQSTIDFDSSAKLPSAGIEEPKPPQQGQF